MSQTAKKNYELLENTVRVMSYHLGDSFDNYYPSIEEIDDFLQDKQNSKGHYSANDISFLIWLTLPLMDLTPQQQEVEKRVESVLESIKNDRPVEDDEYDKEAMRNIFKKYHYNV